MEACLYRLAYKTVFFTSGLPPSPPSDNTLMAEARGPLRPEWPVRVLNLIPCDKLSIQRADPAPGAQPPSPREALIKQSSTCSRNRGWRGSGLQLLAYAHPRDIILSLDHLRRLEVNRSLTGQQGSLSAVRGSAEPVTKFPLFLLVTVADVAK